jgi:hypothetical protein
MVINLVALSLSKQGANGIERVPLQPTATGLHDANWTDSVNRTVNTARRIALANFSTLITKQIKNAVVRENVGTAFDGSVAFDTVSVNYQKLTTMKHDLLLSNKGEGDVTLLVTINSIDDRRWVSVNFRIEPNEKVGE